MEKQNSTKQPKPMRKGALFGMALFAIVLIGVALALKSLNNPPPAPPAPVVDDSNQQPQTSDSLVGSGIARPTVSPTHPTAGAEEIPPEQRPPKDLVAEMMAMCSQTDPITKEQAERFKRNLSALIGQGASAVPAIQELLAKNLDAKFNELAGGSELGYSSLRASMIDALRQIRGPESEAAMVQTLQTSAQPAEMLALANNLQAAAPANIATKFWPPPTRRWPWPRRGS